jgi:hypothetical protein
MTWERVTGSGAGWLIALVVLICVWAGFVFGRFDLQTAFIVSAICAVRL